MGLLSFIFGTENQIDFSDNRVKRLSQLIDELSMTLMKADRTSYIKLLSEIKDAAQNKDNETFKKLVISNSLFGGAGAMWEIWIDDTQLQSTFERQFYLFVDTLQKMGISNGRINQVKSGLRKM